MQSQHYRGRRIFQGVVALIGCAIIGLAGYDLVFAGDGAPREMALEQSQVIVNMNRFMDEQIGRMPIDYLMLALGAWIAYFGLHGILLKGPQLRFDAEGIYYFRFGEQTIPWGALNNIRFVNRRRTSLLRSPSIDLELIDPGAFARRQPLLYRGFRRLTHVFDDKTFTIYGYDIEVPLYRVAMEMKEIVEPSSQDTPDGNDA